MTNGPTAAAPRHAGPEPVEGAAAARGGRTGIEVHVAPVAGTDLVRDYLAGAAALAPFYAGHPFDPDAYARKADAVRQRLRAAERKRVAPALHATTPGAAARLEKILGGDGFVVTTGQQTGLFGGPLYTIYKLLTAVRLAQAVEQIVGEPCLAVFWMASDDHDWAEANHTTVLDAQDAPQRIALAAAPDAPPVPMSERLLGDDAVTAVHTLESVMPTSGFSGPVLDLVRQAYRPGGTMASAFAHLLRGLLQHIDVALLDPANPAVKVAARPLLERELRDAEAHARILTRDARRIQDAGYHAQVTIADDAANVFLHDPLGRDRLVRTDGSWTLRRTRRRLSDAEVVSLLDGDPSRFSPNVLLRPVVESALLPAVAYVGGPAEVAYFAQIGCLFAAHGIEPPIVFPRFGVTLVETRIRKLLDKFAIEPADVRQPFHELVTRVLREELPPAVVEPLGRLRASVTHDYDQLADAAADIDPTLLGWVRRNRNAALSRIDATEKKVLSHVRKRSAIETGQLRRAAAHLFPEGVPQERSLNILPFLGRYGDGLLHDIADAMHITLAKPAPAWRGVSCGADSSAAGLPEPERAE